MIFQAFSSATIAAAPASYHAHASLNVILLYTGLHLLGVLAGDPTLVFVEGDLIPAVLDVAGAGIGFIEFGNLHDPASGGGLIADIHRAARHLNRALGGRINRITVLDHQLPQLGEGLFTDDTIYFKAVNLLESLDRAQGGGAKLTVSAVLATGKTEINERLLKRLDIAARAAFLQSAVPELRIGRSAAAGGRTAGRSDRGVIEILLHQPPAVPASVAQTGADDAVHDAPRLDDVPIAGRIARVNGLPQIAHMGDVAAGRRINEHSRARHAHVLRNGAGALLGTPVGVVVASLGVDVYAGEVLVDTFSQTVAIPDARSVLTPVERLGFLAATVLREPPARSAPLLRVLAGGTHDVGDSAEVQQRGWDKAHEPAILPFRFGCHISSQEGF